MFYICYEFYFWNERLVYINEFNIYEYYDLFEKFYKFYIRKEYKNIYVFIILDNIVLNFILVKRKLYKVFIFIGIVDKYFI